MTETLNHQNPEGPKITKTAILVNGNEYEISTFDGKPFREGTVAQLGKRYICGQEIAMVPASEKKDPGTGKSIIIPGKSEIFSGEYRDKDGKAINLGCGTEALCLKVGTKPEIPICCGLPMMMQKPRQLPNSD
jgi:hypothetical protein